MEEEASARQAGASASCVGMEGEAWWGVGRTLFSHILLLGTSWGPHLHLGRATCPVSAVPVNGQGGRDRLPQFEFCYVPSHTHD